VLQCVAVYYSVLHSVLQCAAVCCSVPQFATVCHSMLQCVAACCSVFTGLNTLHSHFLVETPLQCVAVCCSVLQRVAACCSVLQRVAVCCSALQCVAVCCSTLQSVAVCCSVVQWVLGLNPHRFQSLVKKQLNLFAVLLPLLLFFLLIFLEGRTQYLSECGPVSRLRSVSSYSKGASHLESASSYLSLSLRLSALIAAPLCVCMCV